MTCIIGYINGIFLFWLGDIFSIYSRKSAYEYDWKSRFLYWNFIIWRGIWVFGKMLINLKVFMLTVSYKINKVIISEQNVICSFLKKRYFFFGFRNTMGLEKKILDIIIADKDDHKNSRDIIWVCVYPLLKKVIYHYAHFMSFWCAYLKFCASMYLF